MRIALAYRPVTQLYCAEHRTEKDSATTQKPKSYQTVSAHLHKALLLITQATEPCNLLVTGRFHTQSMTAKMQKSVCLSRITKVSCGTAVQLPCIDSNGVHHKKGWLLSQLCLTVCSYPCWQSGISSRNIHSSACKALQLRSGHLETEHCCR